MVTKRHYLSYHFALFVLIKKHTSESSNKCRKKVATDLAVWDTRVVQYPGRSRPVALCASRLVHCTAPSQTAEGHALSGPVPNQFPDTCTSIVVYTLSRL